MTEETIKTLDLDQLFGQAQPIKVRWQGREYELLTMASISPKQAAQLKKLQSRIEALRNSAEPDTEAIAEMEKIFDEMLRMVGKDLPLEEIPFHGKVAIMRFYIEETQGKKALEVALANSTGATPSPS